MSSIYFHEDDYCQIEILPIENLEFCKRQAGLIGEFADAHRSGPGYTDMFIRGENPIPLRNKGITVASLENKFNGILPRIDEVFTGYSTYREICPDTAAYGYNDEVALFFDFRDGIVDNIWLTLDVRNGDDLAAARILLAALSELGGLLIADWGWDFIENLAESEKIEEYLHKRFKAFSKVQ